MDGMIRQYVFDLFSRVKLTPAVDDLAQAVYDRASRRCDTLIARGISRQEAFDTAVNEIGDVSDMVAEARELERFSETDCRRKKRRFILTGIIFAVASPVPVMTLGKMKGFEDYATALLLIMLIIGVAFFIAAATARPKRIDASAVARGEFPSEYINDRPIYRMTSGVLWILTFAVYVAVGIWTGEWVSTLLIFAVGFCLSKLARAVADFFRTGGGAR